MKMQPLIKELVDLGWSETRIAHAVGTSQPMINRYKNGRINSPSFELGTAIVALHKRVTESKSSAA